LHDAINLWSQTGLISFNFCQKKVSRIASNHFAVETNKCGSGLKSSTVKKKLAVSFAGKFFKKTRKH
jgi:hypothetical protein